MKYNGKYFKGFTLIELLVVISIIAIIAAISIFGLQGAREAGRDAKRKSDIESIRSALELYRRDCGQYPGSVTGGSSISGNCPTSLTYMDEVPKDPAGGYYNYSPSGLPPTSYTITTTLEDGTPYQVGSP